MLKGIPQWSCREICNNLQSLEVVLHLCQFGSELSAIIISSQQINCNTGLYSAEKGTGIERFSFPKSSLSQYFMLF